MERRKKAAVALGMLGATSIALIAALKAKAAPPPVPGGPMGEVKLEVIPPTGYGKGNPVYPPRTTVKVTGVARRGVPAPDMELQLQVYDTAFKVYVPYKVSGFTAVALNQPQTLAHTFTDYGESGRYRGYMKLSNPVGSVEYVTDPLDLVIGEAPAGEVTVGV